jgi:hypothetical protein
MNHRIDLSKVAEPAWLKVSASNACLNSRDLMEIFKLHKATFENLIKTGRFPPPDAKGFVTHTDFGVTRTHSRQWRVSTIRKFFKEMKHEEV